MEYPIRRPRRDGDYKGPRPKPGQTAMICPVCRAKKVFAFTPDDKLRCITCGFEIARSETV